MGNDSEEDETPLKQAETKMRDKEAPSLYFRGLPSTGCFSQEGNHHWVELLSTYCIDEFHLWMVEGWWYSL